MSESSPQRRGTLTHVRTLMYLVLTLGLQASLLGCAKPAARYCNITPECRRYLEAVRQSVYEHWTPADDVREGRVRVSFRLDATGRITEIRIEGTDSEKLAASCMSALQAADGPDIPESIAPLLQKRIIATFDFFRDKSP